MKLYYLSLLLCLGSSILCEDSETLKENLEKLCQEFNQQCQKFNQRAEQRGWIQVVCPTSCKASHEAAKNRIQQINILFKRLATELSQGAKQNLECLEESNFGKPACEKTRLEIWDLFKDCLKESNFKNPGCEQLRSEAWQFIYKSWQENNKQK